MSACAWHVRGCAGQCAGRSRTAEARGHAEHVAARGDPLAQRDRLRAMLGRAASRARVALDRLPRRGRALLRPAASVRAARAAAGVQVGVATLRGASLRGATPRATFR
eukprot:5877914-Prymnesium_polylepis.3